MNYKTKLNNTKIITNAILSRNAVEFNNHIIINERVSAMKKFNEAEILEQAKEQHPEAESIIVAVDLAAQALYKKIQHDINEKATAIDQYDDIELYHYLRRLRLKLLNNKIQESSSFTKKEGLHYGT